MYERPPVKVKAEPRSTFTLTRDRPSIASILFTRLKITRQWKSAFREFAAMFTLYRITQLRRRENHTGYGFCSHKNGDFGEILARFRKSNEAAPRQSLKWRVTRQIGVHTIPDTVPKAMQYNVNIA